MGWHGSEWPSGYIAQWLERLTADQQVPGSNPGVPSFLESMHLSGRRTNDKKTLFKHFASAAMVRYALQAPQAVECPPNFRAGWPCRSLAIK